MAAVLVMILAVCAGSVRAAERIFFEAEDMQIDGQNWQVREHFGGWYYGVPSNGKMLCGSVGGQGEARKTVDIKTAGTYRVMVRYLDDAYRGPFKVAVVQNNTPLGEKIFDTKSLRETPEGQAKWGGGFGQFVWDEFTVKLAEGKVDIILTKAEPIGVSWIARYPDLFVLTDDPKYEPKLSDFMPPLYMKVRMGPTQTEPCVLHIFGRIPQPPWWIPHSNIYKSGLVEGCYTSYQPGGKNEDFLTAGKESAWFNIAPYLFAMGDNRMDLTAMQQYFTPLPTADFTVYFSTTPSDSGIFKTFSRSGPGAGMTVMIDLSKRDNIKSDKEWSREARDVAEKLPPVDGKRPQAFPIITGCAINSTQYQQETVENEIKTLSILGFNSIGGYDPLFYKNGFTKLISGVTYFHLARKGCLSDPDMPAIKSIVLSSAQSVAKNWPLQDIIAWSLMDEPGSVSMEHIVNCQPCIAGFREYLKKMGLKPENFGKKEWNEVLPSKNKTDAKQYYYTALYRNQVLADFFKIGTDLLNTVIPGAKTTANFGEMLTYCGNMLLSGDDWFLIHQTGGLTFGWTEDWLNHSGMFQLCGYRADFLRAACNFQGQDFAMYTIFRQPWDMQAKIASEIGHGATALFYYNYGPYYAPSVDQCSTYYAVYPAIREVNHAIGKVEDYLVGTKVPRSRIGLLYSHTTDIWTLDQGTSLFGKERMHLWVLLRHLGYPVDILTEKDVIENRIKDYKAIFFSGSHLHADAVEPLSKWVRDGGLLYLGAGSGLYDQFNQASKLDTYLGISREPFTFVNEPGREYFEFPAFKVLSSVRLNDGNTTETMEVVCGMQKIKNPGTAEIIASFSDGTPALAVRNWGNGKIAVCGFFPAIAYSRNGFLQKRALDAQLAKENKESVTSSPPEFPSVYRTLISSVLKKVSYSPLVKTSEPLVEANLREGPKGTLIAISNWSGRQIKNLQISVETGANRGKPFAAISKIKSLEKKGRILVMTLDMDGACDFIVIPAK